MRYKYNPTTASTLLNSARYRAAKKRIKFSLTPLDIYIPEFCPILGVKMRAGYGKATMFSPSLDRIDPTRGYVPGNVQVICRLANTMKQNATVWQLQRFAKWVMTKYPVEVKPAWDELYPTCLTPEELREVRKILPAPDGSSLGEPANAQEDSSQLDKKQPEIVKV